jgi:predicted DNA-binding ribbon-helix-helix protein
MTVAIRVYVVDYLRERLRRRLSSQRKPDARH